MDHENIFIAESAIANAQNSIETLKAIIVEQQKSINELEGIVNSLQVCDGDVLTVELSVDEHKKLLDIQEKYNKLKKIIKISYKPPKLLKVPVQWNPEIQDWETDDNVSIDDIDTFIEWY